MIIKRTYKTISLTIFFAVMIMCINGNSYAVETVYYDFKNVELDTTSKAKISISTSSSRDVILDSLTFQNGSYFEIITEIPDGGIVVPSNQSIIIEVGFTPKLLGSVTDVLNIYSDSPFNPIVGLINLSGTGISKKDITIDDILSFFDSSVESGALIGRGAGRPDDNNLNYTIYNQKMNKLSKKSQSAEKKLNALRNMLIIAGKLIKNEDVEKACE